MTIVPDSFQIDNQEYQCVGFQDYRNRFGQLIRLIRLRSHCPECGAAFEFTTTKTQIMRRAINRRRCEAHKSPGVRVSGHNWRRRSRGDR